MRNYGYGILVLSLSILIGTAARASEGQRLGQDSTRLVWELNPTSLFYLRGDDFKISPVSHGPDNALQLSPNTKIGVSYGDEVVRVQAMAGYGHLFEGDYDGGFYTADVGLWMSPAVDRIAFTPRIGLIHLGDIRYSSSTMYHGKTGWFSGVGIQLGGRRVAFTLGMDYIRTSYDVERSSRDTREMDMSGFWMNMGITFRF